jgi:hypothetical protein
MTISKNARMVMILLTAQIVTACGQDQRSVPIEKIVDSPSSFVLTRLSQRESEKFDALLDAYEIDGKVNDPAANRKLVIRINPGKVAFLAAKYYKKRGVFFEEKGGAKRQILTNEEVANRVVEKARDFIKQAQAKTVTDKNSNNTGRGAIFPKSVRFVIRVKLETGQVWKVTGFPAIRKMRLGDPVDATYVFGQENNWSESECTDERNNQKQDLLQCLFETVYYFDLHNQRTIGVPPLRNESLSSGLLPSSKDANAWRWVAADKH